MIDYDALLDRVLALLRQVKRLAYRVLRRRVQLDDETLEDLKDDLIYAKHLAMDEDAQVLSLGWGAPKGPLEFTPAAFFIAAAHCRHVATPEATCSAVDV